MTEFVDISMSRIGTLHPQVVESAQRAFQKCLTQRVPVYILWSSRSYEEQALMYRMGRSLIGPILTHRRPGYSPHNFSLALDFCLLDGKKLLSWDDCFDNDKRHEQWFKVLRAFESEGWEAGFRWPSFEPGHLQNLMGMTIGELHAKANENRNNGN